MGLVSPTEGFYYFTECHFSFLSFFFLFFFFTSSARTERWGSQRGIHSYSSTIPTWNQDRALSMAGGYGWGSSIGDRLQVGDAAQLERERHDQD